MRLHDRYLFRELLTPLAFCLGGFLVFWISFFFFKEMETIQEKNCSLLDTAEYAPPACRNFLCMVLPILLLLALLYALTHHARHNEITALRAAGVGLWRLCAPYFVVGLAGDGNLFCAERNRRAALRPLGGRNFVAPRQNGNQCQEPKRASPTSSFAPPTPIASGIFGEYDAGHRHDDRIRP